MLFIIEYIELKFDTSLALLTLGIQNIHLIINYLYYTK